MEADKKWIFFCHFCIEVTLESNTLTGRINKRKFVMRIGVNSIAFNKKIMS